MPDISKLREKVSFYLEDSNTSTGKTVDLILLAFNLLACGLFVAITEQGERIPLILKTAEVIVVSVFVIEYLLRVWTAKSKLKYIFSSYGIIDLVSILPSLVTINELRFLSVLKVLRILRFLRFLENENFFFGKISRFQLQVCRTVFTVFTILFVSSGLILFAETGSEHATIKSFGIAFYFCVTTLSTVGFGDFTPVTAAGRWVTTVMILGGAILVPWQAGKLVHMLILNDANKKNTTCPKCGLTGHDPDASHCKACGSVIFQEFDGSI